MATAGATSLNRILRITANLMFQNGEDVAAVCNLMQGFVTPTMIRDWHERYCHVHGIMGAQISRRTYRRMPMPPIDFEKVKLPDIEALLERAPDEQEEPDW